MRQNFRSGSRSNSVSSQYERGKPREDPNDVNLSLTKQQQREKQRPEKPAIKCYGCGKPGHILANCRQLTKEQRQAKWLEITRAQKVNLVAEHGDVDIPTDIEENGSSDPAPINMVEDSSLNWLLNVTEGDPSNPSGFP